MKLAPRDRLALVLAALGFAGFTAGVGIGSFALGEAGLIALVTAAFVGAKEW